MRIFLDAPTLLRGSRGGKKAQKGLTAENAEIVLSF